MTESDEQLRSGMMLPNGCSLYEYFCCLPIEELERLPETGRLGSIPFTPRVRNLRNYILHWRHKELELQQKYPREVLEQLSEEALQALLRTCLKQHPFWVYEQTARACLDILSTREEAPALRM